MNNQPFQNSLMTGNTVPFPVNSGYMKNRERSTTSPHGYAVLFREDEQSAVVRQFGLSEQKRKEQLERAKAFEIQQLNPVIKTLAHSRKSLPPKRVLKVKRVAPLDITKELNWIKEHRTEYVGEWVALKGDVLISHGSNGLEVYEKARSAGIKNPFLAQIESEDELPFGGW